MAELDWAAIRSQALDGFALAALPPTLELPALPHAVTLFVQRSNDPKVTARELAQIVETDSGLTLELLRHVNSAYVGLVHKANTVQQAISLLGLRRSKTLIITAGLQAAVRSKKSRLINQNAFWNACLQKALFAKEAARLLRADGETAFAGGLLQDYLLPVITNDLIEHYVCFIQERERQPECLCEFERQRFGWDHALVAAALAHRWHLSDELVCCLLFHHHGLKVLADATLRRTSVAAVALSALLPEQLRQEVHGLDELLSLQEKWSVFDLERLARTVDEQHAQSGMGLQNDYPLLRRCQAVAASDRYADGTLVLAASA
ncbi:MAG TPA: HDOD domain-containing protein [Planctomycetaceae bacterium]|nr:HDOD domain-containing protein [Planctomycetaceae bacterium]